MAWVNYILNHRIIDVSNKHQRGGVTNVPRDRRPTWWNIDRPALNHQRNSDRPHDDWEMQIYNPSAGDEDSRLLKAFIAEDLEGMFSERHIQNLPNATFKNICLMQLEGNSWKEIAEHFGTSIPTASGFYRHNLDRLLVYFRKSFPIE